MNLTKRILPLLLALVLALGLTAPAARAAGFSDVPEDAWYAADVSDIQRYGLINGVGDGRFDPDGTMTLAQAVTLTARTHAYARGETVSAGSGSPWYQPYVEYAADRGLCAAGEFGTAYNDPCSRLTMAKLFDRAVPEDTEKTLNTVAALPDVADTPENRSVFHLYELGILTGSDRAGTFRPDSPISRAEAAAILNRVLDSSRRKTFTLESSTVSAGSSFEVYFLDVGQADAALVRCDGHAMLIDGGNAEDSQLVYTFLKNHDISYLDYIVCTHAHEDHVGGLAGALNYATVGTAYCPVTSYDSRAFDSFVKYLDRQGVSITVPEAGDTFSLGSAQAQIVGPIRSSEEPNNTSIVLRIVYGGTSFLFTGDAEREEEQDILDAGYALESTVLKVGHHGSAGSTTYPFLRAVMPDYAVISVGAGNSYGHPTEAALSRLRDAGATVYRTDLQGEIRCVSDGSTVTFRTEKDSGTDAPVAPGQPAQPVQPSQPEQPTRPVQPSQPEQPTQPVQPSQPAQPAQPEQPARSDPAAREYVLNTNTKKFHYPDCKSVGKMKEKNKLVRTDTREAIIADGYEPCGICNP